MAKVSITVDTETKEVTASINGKVIQKVNSMNISTYRDENGKPYGIDVRFEVNEYDDDVSKCTTYYAYGSHSLEKLDPKKDMVYNDSVPECVEVIKINSQLVEDITKYLGY